MKAITIISHGSKSDSDLVTITMCDLLTGKNKVQFDCHLSSLIDIVLSNLTK